MVWITFAPLGVLAVLLLIDLIAACRRRTALSRRSDALDALTRIHGRTRR